MQYSSMPNKFGLPFAENAGSGYIRDIPEASQIGITNGAASLNDGFPPVCFTPVGSGGTPPWGQDINGILNQISAWNQWQQAGGTVRYDATFCTKIGGYPLGTIVASSSIAGLLWYNTTDNNTTDPDGGGASGWITLKNNYSVHYGVDTGSGNTVTCASVSPAVGGSVVAGMLFEIVKSASANSGAVSATISGQAGSVLWADGTALASADWPASVPALLMFDGTYYRILSVMGPSVFARVGNVQPILNAARTYYVSPTGNDSNDGLTSGAPFATFSHAITVVQKLNLNGYAVTLQSLGGTWTSEVFGTGAFYGGGTVTIVGDTVSPASHVISVSSGSAILAQYGCELAVRGFTLTSSDAANGAITAQFQGYVDVTGACVFGSSAGYQLGALDGGQVRLRASYTISGGAVQHWHVSNMGQITKDTAAGVTVTLVGTPAFSGAFASASILGIISIIGITMSGSATGSRYAALNNAVIDTGSGDPSFLPGSGAGTTLSGAIYL